jgi:hypothetical protein
MLELFEQNRTLIALLRQLIDREIQGSYNVKLDRCGYDESGHDEKAVPRQPVRSERGDKPIPPSKPAEDRDEDTGAQSPYQRGDQNCREQSDEGHNLQSIAKGETH